MLIALNSVVTINYTLKDNDGQVLDQSQNDEFVYLHGASNIIPGLENALLDKKAGDSLSVTVSPEMGYGERNDTLSQVVSMDMFDSEDKLTIGQQFHAQGDNSEDIMITITAINGDDVTIVNVRAASEEETAHGHVHQPGHSH